MRDCPFCHPELDPHQKIILSNPYCLFLQLDLVEQKGVQLEGTGIIVPKAHRETAFDLTQDEWQATFTLLQEAKAYLDDKHHPQGYNLGWNCGEIGGQHIFHAHFHVLPRYEDEPLAGKGIRYMFKSSANQRKITE